MATEACQRLQFYPFAYALATEELANYCWYCLAPVKDKARCTGCQCAVYCNKQCHQLGWKDHKAECTAISRAGEIPDIETRVLGRIVVRHKDILKKKDKKIENFYKDRKSERSIMQIWAHTEEIKKDKRAMDKFEDIYNNLSSFYENKHMLPKDVVFELHCRNYINRHAISDRAYVKEIGKGLYLDLCAYDHSCSPNTIYTCNGFVATLRSLNGSNNIKNRETTFYSYIDLLNSQPERLKQLKDTWYFECKCTRCIDPGDHILTGLKCPNCPANDPTSLCIFGTHAYKNKLTAVITCPKCKKDMQRDYVFEGINTMKFINKVFNDREIEQMPSKTRVEFLEDLLDRATKILPNVNVYLCNIHLIPLVDVNNHKELLRLHLISEDCVRQCYPKNHPGIAFHLRSIGLFYSGLKDYPSAVKYIQEAIDILNFTLDADHPMTVETEEILKETIAASQQDPTEVFAPRHDAPAQQPAQPELLGEKKTAASESDEANEMDAKDVPSRSRDAEQIRRDIAEDSISHINYIKMYLAGRLGFPEGEEIPFTMSELDDIEPLGTGSYGTVRRMVHRSSGHEMAVKRVRITNSGSDDVGINQSMKRLRHEVEAIKSASNCENIVRFYGLTFHEGDAWVCMELMDISLEHLYQTAHRVYEGKSLFNEPTLGSVAISDQYHIIHRDIKPSNILLSHCGAVKVCDFGICGYLQDSVAQTREAGCRPYMAPEKLSSKNYDIRSEVWSLGLTMIEVANFAFPYPGFNEAPVFTQLQMVVYEDPPMVKNTKYSLPLRHFTNMCVIKDYRERPNFMELMKTKYYLQYENFHNIKGKVAEYVSEMLPHREHFKKTEQSLA